MASNFKHELLPLSHLEFDNRQYWQGRKNSHFLNSNLPQQDVVCTATVYWKAKEKRSCILEFNKNLRQTRGQSHYSYSTTRSLTNLTKDVDIKSQPIPASSPPRTIRRENIWHKSKRRGRRRIDPPRQQLDDSDNSETYVPSIITMFVVLGLHADIWDGALRV